jgi:ankyrin repeat protein
VATPRTTTTDDHHGRPLLLEHGSAVYAPEGDCLLTPLHYAASRGRADVVALLLAHGADRHAKCWDERTPLDFARENGDPETIRLLSGGK